MLTALLVGTGIIEATLHLNNQYGFALALTSRITGATLLISQGSSPSKHKSSVRAPINT